MVKYICWESDPCFTIKKWRCTLFFRKILLKSKWTKQITLNKGLNFRFWIQAFQKDIRKSLFKLLTSTILIIIFSIHWNFSKIILKRTMRQQSLDYKISISKKLSLNRKFNNKKKKLDNRNKRKIIKTKKNKNIITKNIKKSIVKIIKSINIKIKMKK